MVDKVTDIKSKINGDSPKIGTGGRLYRDAREREGGDRASTPHPEVDQQAPVLPTPWSTRPVGVPNVPEVKKRDWQQFIATLLQLAGMFVLSAGFGMLYLWLGIVVLGICMIVLGIAAGLPSTNKSEVTR